MRSPVKNAWPDSRRDEEPYHPLVCFAVQVFLLVALWTAIILGARWLFS